MNLLIAALKRQMDADGALTLDKSQAQYLIFLLEDIGDVPDISFAIADLIGSLSEKEVSA